MKHRFNPWVSKISWRRNWQPTPVFLPGESHGQRSLADYSPQDCKSRTRLSVLYSEDRSLCISLLRFPFGEEIRELSKGSHTSGQHCFSNCDRSWLQEWALLQVEVQKLLLKKAVRVFKSPFSPKCVTRNRRELTPRKDWSGRRSFGVKIWRFMSD